MYLFNSLIYIRNILTSTNKLRLINKYEIINNVNVKSNMLIFILYVGIILYKTGFTKKKKKTRLVLNYLLTNERTI